MRIDRLDLIRYGHFTDRSIALPQDERDFHVIVGPNEAGKSTVRAAVLDLLYGIPKNTSHAFLHPMPEMRLGARLVHGGQLLDLQRVKGNKQTLRDMADLPLADDALAVFLGSSDRDFFTQMFGLDHERLVKGGHGILSASNDLGQILFQSAAGIAGLGAVRDDLEAQADGLWSKRRSSERKYYIAADELERAAKALKDATVRTKDWSVAHDRLSELDRDHAELRRDHAGIKTRRNLLDRVRRVVPHLKMLDSAATQLAALGSVVELDPSAGKTMADAEKTIARAQADIERHHEVIAQARAVLEGLVVDNGVLAAAVEIEQLNEQRLQYRVYPADIARWQSEVDAQWALARSSAAELGWDTDDEATLRARLPSASARAALGRLVRSHAALEQALAASERAVQAKRADVVLAREALAGLAGSEPSLELQAALGSALKLGDYQASLDERRKAVRKQQAAVATAFAALGPWRCEVECLRAMVVPSADTIRSLAQEQLNDDARVRVLSDRITTLEQQERDARAEVAQYRSTHQAVTLPDVTEARSTRDATWQAIKSDPVLLARRGHEFESQVSMADALADRRHDTARQASELQARQALVARMGLELEQARQERTELESLKDKRVLRWSTLASRCGLPDLPFEAAAPWLEARDAALEAAQGLDEAKGALEALEAAMAEACTGLALALRASDVANEGLPGEGMPGEGGSGEGGSGAGTAGEGASLAALVLDAQRKLQEAADVGGQRRALQKQVADGERDVMPLQDALRKTGEAAAAWRQQWALALDDAGLDRESDVPTVERMLDGAQKIDTALASMRQIQDDRIDRMRADLDGHATAARELAGRLAPELADQSATDTVVGLVTRLVSANASHQESERQHASIRSAQHQLDDATSKRVQAQATLAPLLQRAGLHAIGDLPDAIERSDQRRACLAICAAAQKEIDEAGGGLSLEQLRSEAAQVDLSTLTVELEDLAEQEQGLVDRLADLSARRQAATTVLEAIGGSADAAAAEAQRQQALASMSDIALRYVKLCTAAKLLRWSIERYREARQGPMLSAASNVFARLTGGSFEKLVVDFEHEPPKLLGRRPNGSMVEIEGMSEGTRDQLYLALRLAALDLHLDHAQALPFIADDLFINYDDTRSTSALEALGELSRKTQVLFLTHHAHLLPAVRKVFGGSVNIVSL